jgi:hypothetical protein
MAASLANIWFIEHQEPRSASIRRRGRVVATEAVLGSKSKFGLGLALAPLSRLFRGLVAWRDRPADCHRPVGHAADHPLHQLLAADRHRDYALEVVDILG